MSWAWEECEEEEESPQHHDDQYMRDNDKYSEEETGDEGSRGETERTHHASFQDYYDALMQLQFVATTFADQAVLHDMDIHNDVYRIFSSMGLGYLP